MNIGIIIFILGSILKITGALMFIPCIIAAFCAESAGYYFLATAVISLLLGVLITRKRPQDTVFYLKEGCVATALSWLVISFVSCLPMWLSGAIGTFTDALFEMVSGYTTTGSSILNDIEVLPYSCLFWRSFSHWIGGMGVLVFMLAVLPLSSGSRMNLMKAESPGPTVGKLAPKVRETARILYFLYIILTLIELAFLLAGRMPAFDALMITFGTAGTGGFGVRNSSIAEYSPYIQWVVGIFMMLFGINFNAYFFIYRKRIKEAFAMEEVKCYVGMIAVATAIIFLNMYHRVDSASKLLRDVFFQVSSLTTSTGFVTADFDKWTDLSKYVLIIIMFVGACAGSTGGGLKVQRCILLLKNFLREMKYYLHPRSVRTIKYDGKTVDESTISSINVYFLTFFLIFVSSIFLVSLEGRDLMTSFSAVLTTINNMGPGFSAVGPTSNFSEMSTLSKYVLMFDMLAGRLELYPMLLILNPVLWKDTFSSRHLFR